MVNSANANPWYQQMETMASPMDAFQNGKVHLINVTSDRLSLPFKDGIDNDGDGEEGNPIVTQSNDQSNRIGCPLL